MVFYFKHFIYFLIPSVSFATSANRLSLICFENACSADISSQYTFVTQCTHYKMWLYIISAFLRANVDLNVFVTALLKNNE